jgi:hypothetical protein
MAMVFRRRSTGRHVWVDPGAPVPVLEELHPNYGRLLLELMNGELESVTLPPGDAQDQLTRLASTPPPNPPKPARRSARQRTG